MPNDKINRLDSIKNYINKRLLDYHDSTHNIENKKLVHKIIIEIPRYENIEEILSAFNKILKLYQQRKEDETLIKLIERLMLQINNIDYLKRVGDSEIEKSNDNKIVFSDIFNKINFNDLSIIYVYGGSYNQHGHAILKLGDYGYIHINTLYGRPQYIRNDEDFGAYLHGEGGGIFGIQPLSIKYPNAAKQMLLALTKGDWLWEIVHHNCLTFIHKIAIAGGESLARLGYTDPHTMHTVEKYPHDFYQMQRKNREELIDLPEEKNQYSDEIKQQFNNLFKDAEQSNREEIIEYYVTLRNNGISKNEALEYIAIGYGMVLSEKYKQEIEREHIKSNVGTFFLKRSQELKASLGAGYTLFSGDHRPAIERAENHAEIFNFSMRQSN